MRDQLIRKLPILSLLVTMIVIFSFSGEYFATENNIRSILLDASKIGLVAIGMTFVIIGGGIDLSVGSIIGFMCIFVANIIYYTNLHIAVVFPIMIVVSTLIGMINGLIITKLKVQDFIATLVSMGIFRGLALVFSLKDELGYIRNVPLQSNSLKALSTKIGPIYVVSIVFIVVAILMNYFLKRTRIGTSIYAIGADKRSSILSGVNVTRTKIVTYIISAIMSGIAAIFIMSEAMTANAEYGTGIELQAIAASVIGGTAFSGGRGDIIGTLIGTLFLAVLSNGIYKLGLTPAVMKPIIIGIVLLLSMIIDKLMSMYSVKRSRRRLTNES